VRSVARGDVPETFTPRAAQIDETGQPVQAANDQISSSLRNVLSTSAAQNPATIKRFVEPMNPRGARVVALSAGFVADRGDPGHLPPCIEKCSQCARATIVERLAAPDAANIEFEAPQAGQLFRAPDFS
jgi:hypothetical protein